MVKAAQGRVPVFLDGGVRRGTDVFKALALGASGIFVSSECQLFILFAFIFAEKYRKWNMIIIENVIYNPYNNLFSSSLVQQILEFVN